MKSFLASSPESRAVRVNTIKTSPNQFEKYLKHHCQEYKKIPFNSTGYIIGNDDLPLSHTLSFFKGHFQYQGISSQLPVVLLDAKPGQRVLDMTAAPGSKSTQIAAMMENSGELILNDISSSRQQALNVNMQRNGALNFYILKMRGERLGLKFFEYFDKILLDAPCSALGTLAGSPEVASWWSLKKMHKLTQVQYHLLVSAIKALKVNGELIYSTCSITPEENELLIHKILENYPLEVVETPASIKMSFSSGITNYGGWDLIRSLEKGIRIWPHLHSMEGFFAIKLRKYDSTEKVIDLRQQEYGNTLESGHPTVIDILQNLTYLWGIPSEIWDNYRYIITKTKIWMVSKSIKRYLVNSLISGGLLLAEKRLFGWKLSHASAQALSNYISDRKVELNDVDLCELFNKGSIKLKNIKAGYYALVQAEEAIASVYVEDGTMRIRLPHSFNLVL